MMAEDVEEWRKMAESAISRLFPPSVNTNHNFRTFAKSCFFLMVMDINYGCHNYMTKRSLKTKKTREREKPGGQQVMIVDQTSHMFKCSGSVNDKKDSLHEYLAKK